MLGFRVQDAIPGGCSGGVWGGGDGGVGERRGVGVGWAGGGEHRGGTTGGWAEERVDVELGVNGWRVGGLRVGGVVGVQAWMHVRGGGRGGPASTPSGCGFVGTCT